MSSANLVAFNLTTFPHQLLALQKKPPNALCVDCGVAAPQWASPKFGTFMCLECAGVHRGLGVHVSFVRSVQMDSFKVNEVKRMEEGGNEAWRTFFDQHADGGNGDKSVWGTMAVGDRYTGDTGDEYKERLSAKVEGREYVPQPKKEKPKLKSPAASSDAAAGLAPGSGRNTPQGGRRTPLNGGRNSPAPRSGSPHMSGGGPGAQKEKNEAYFARMGAENASRPEDLPPSQGGKFGGFGSSYAPEPKQGQDGMPGVDDFQKDPVAALTKGFGWFTTTVGKTAKTVNDGWVQPGIQKVCGLRFDEWS
jgi:ADP-ribosylation factor GTPase-activating protein 1